MKARKKHPKGRGWCVCGFDTSPASIAGAAIAYDNVLKKRKGPVFVSVRWSVEDPYFTRLKTAVKAHDLVHRLQADLGVGMGLDEVFICQEEPWPMGMPHQRFSDALKQQAEISGAFLGGLVRYGFQNVVQINSIRWRKIVADDLGVTTHHSKWRSPELALKYNCKPQDSGKFRSKQWALEVGIDGFPNKIPDLPDIIERREGKIPRPEGSVAKAVQPDDVYDALAIAWVLVLELRDLGMLQGGFHS